MAQADPDRPPQPPGSCEVAVIGGGIVGLAVARQLLISFPRLSVCVIERERELASHQSSHNSGVVHAGVYYAPGSLKARLCVRGASELYEYCAEHGIAFERCGKLIVARQASELARLDELQRRGTANGVLGLRRIGADAISEYEPHARGVAAVHCPQTGIVDFAALARSYAAEFVAAGGTIATHCELQSTSAGGHSLTLRHSRGVTDATHAIFCAGAWSDRLALAAGAERDPRILPFRGAYLRLVDQRRDLVRSLIYPVPDPSLPFLGVHLTRRIDGDVLIGPTALLAGARDAYRLRTIRGRDLLDTLAWPGSWRMFARWWSTGLTEIHHAVRPAALLDAARGLVPELRAEDLRPAFAGVRAQAVHRDGRLADDFVFSSTPRALHVRNAPSPAATSSLAIARHIVEQARRAFDLRRPQRP
jgi:2-hydroxyglutarate dehydrogenase